VCKTEPVSSGSIVSDYGLDDRAIEVRFPAGAKDFFSSLCVQIGSGAHPASCTMGTGGLSLGVKRGRGVTLTTHPHLVPRSRMSRSYTSTAPKRLQRVAGLLYLLQCVKPYRSFFLKNVISSVWAMTVVDVIPAA
jgi:hypothetical protein